MDERANELRCLSLPLLDHEMLVPGAVVAEVIPYLSHSPVDVDAPWLLGRFPWRGVALPLVSIEVATQLSSRPAIGRRVAIFNTVGGNPALPFYAIFIQAVPRLVNLNRPGLKEIHPENNSPLLRHRVEIARNRALIPDLDKLETLVLNAWSKIYAQGPLSGQTT